MAATLNDITIIAVAVLADDDAGDGGDGSGFRWLSFHISIIFNSFIICIGVEW